MSLVIPAENLPFVQSLIASGEFQTETQVVGAALSKLEADRRKIETLREQLQPSIERLDRGEGIELDDAGLDAFFEEIIQESDGQSQREVA
jgi:Arc/MetJ-type ribon-helix-helix transcriptional regulator